MLQTKTQHSVLTGGSFLITPAPDTIFTTADFSEEQRMIAQSVKDFIEQEVEPLADQLEEKKDLSLATRLLERSGELGLLGLGVPEAYGGFEASFNTTLLMVEQISASSEFAPTIGVQTSIGIAPILLYGNEKQKERYLPKLVSGEWKSCYCLTEPDAGSDANSGKTKAMPIEEGQAYRLNGQKMWITNAGLANIFIVFAKIENDKNLSAFIVEKDFGGISLGEEEKKMGIKASSTRQVFFNEVRVPAENLLGSREEGFKMALNVLSTGRIKLGVGAIGISKKVMKHALQYANSRKQFGQPIGTYGAIQQKIGNMAAKLFALEAAAYRTGHLIDQKEQEFLQEGRTLQEAKSASVMEFSLECAMLKVFGTEVQDFLVDEGVQIFGGMGFSEEAPMARLYRDARISRIFEGTNEINRMLIVDMLLKKAMKGKLDLMSAAMAVQKEITAIPDFSTPEDNQPLAEAFRQLEQLKKAVLLISGAAAQKLMMQLKDEQEILMWVADMLIQLYMLESVLVKAKMKITLPGNQAGLYEDLSLIFLHEANQTIETAGKEALYAFAEGDDQRMLLLALKRYTKLTPANLKDARRRLAQHLLEAERYTF